MLNNFRITVVSLPDRENLVAEVFYDNEQWVEISQETDDLMIRFYEPPQGDHWIFSYREATAALETAKNKLLNVG